MSSLPYLCCRNQTRIGHIFGITFLAAMVVLIGGTPSRASEQPFQPSLADLVRQLSSNDISQRVEAQKQLAQRSSDDPDQLLEAYFQADSESRTRLLQLLEGIFLSCDDARGEWAEKAIVRLRDAGSVQAKSILIGNARLRESRARQALERLGGQVTYIHPANNVYPRITSPGIGVGFGEPAEIRNILIPEDWKGTVDDLWHLQRLDHLPNLVIYNIRGSRIETEDILPYAAHLSGLTIQERGACLGIHCVPGGTRAKVLHVVRNSAAEAGGIRQNDEILTINGTQVDNFQHLVEILTGYKAGDEIRISVLREGREKELTVKLASWKTMIAQELQSVQAPGLFPGPLGIAVPPSPAPPTPAAEEQRIQFENN